MKPVFEKLAREMNSEGNEKALVRRALDKPLGYVKTFLSYAEKTEALKPVFEKLAREMNSEGNEKALVRRAARLVITDLGE